jgi:hypothetical protein
MPRHGLQALDPDHPIKLPLETLRMGTKMIDAAILYIYGDPNTGIRVTDYDELTEIAGCTKPHLMNTKNDHQWEQYRLDMLGEKFQKRNAGELGFLGKNRTPDELKRIEEERERLLAEIPDLKKQAKKIQATLNLLPANDKRYLPLINALDKVTAMLADRTGVTDKKAEEEELRKALIRVSEAKAKSGTNKPTEHESEDHSRTIDLPS